MTNEEQQSAILKLILQGYLEYDFDIGDKKITFRNLNKKEQRYLQEKYKGEKSTKNFVLVIELLTLSIEKINGIKIEKSQIADYLNRFNPAITRYLYYLYDKMLVQIRSLLEDLEDFVRCELSKSYWVLFKRLNVQKSFEELEDVNEFQLYWIISNNSLDLIESNFYEWQRSEYLAKYICAFLNPKEYKKLEKNFNVSQNLERALTGKIADDSNDEFDNADMEVFDNLNKKSDETKDEYAQRVSEAVKECLKGEKLDDHALAVRKYEIMMLQRMILAKRMKFDIAKEIARRSKKVDEFDDENQEPIAEEEKRDFYRNGIDYSELIHEKIFAEISKKIKLMIFEEMMNFEIDISKHVEKALADSKKEKMVINPIKQQAQLVDFGPSVLKEMKKKSEERWKRIDDVLNKRKIKQN